MSELAAASSEKNILPVPVCRSIFPGVSLGQGRETRKLLDLQDAFDRRRFVLTLILFCFSHKICQFVDYNYAA